MKLKLYKSVYIIICIIFIIITVEYFCKRITPYNMTLFDIFNNTNTGQLLYELKPNTEVIFTGQKSAIPFSKIRTSSKAIRDYEYTIEKPEDTFRIIILGDSVAFGWGINLEDSLSKRLEILLNNKSDITYEVINFSVPGYNLVQEIDTLKYKCIEYSPDLIIFILSNNDYRLLFNYHHPIKRLEPLYPYLKKSYVFRHMMNVYIQRMDFKRKHKLDQGLKEASTAVKHLKKIIKNNNLSVVFYPDVEWAMEIIRKNNLEGNIIYSEKEYYNNEKYKIKGDGHPNALGHEIMAEELFNYLKNTINFQASK